MSPSSLLFLAPLLAVYCLAQESTSSVAATTTTLPAETTTTTTLPAETTTTTVESTTTEFNATCQSFEACYSNEECGIKKDGTNGTCIGAFIKKCNCNACITFWSCETDEQCGGLKGACNKDTKKCDCNEGYKTAGYTSYLDALTKLCNQKDCDGTDSDACHGLPCNKGSCFC